MNLQKVKEVVAFYKKHFHEISGKEIYKWTAVKHFQENWDIEAQNFAEMLEESLGMTANLLAAENFFPRRMLLQNAVLEPETVRQLFVKLYDEEIDLQERITEFRSEFRKLNAKYFPNTNDYQYLGPILVYLNLRFPDRYYFYKFGIFKTFAEKVDYPHKPIKGRLGNAAIYFPLCELVKSEIIKDKELLELHKQRITENEFFDNSYNILTQDVIYSSEIHFGTFEQSTEKSLVLGKLVKTNKKLIPLKSNKVLLKGSIVNYIENEKVKRRIGTLGELLVLEHEKERLRKRGSKKEPEHIAITKGDGEGYDILSYDDLDKEIFIEVKTTTGRHDASFFITRNELEKSKKESEQFYLYRVYNFREQENSAEFCVINGSLEAFCINPYLYDVKISSDE